MEFRLIYEGSLPAEKCEKRPADEPVGRATDKHRIRKHFQPQLRELCQQHPDLREQAKLRVIRQPATGRIIVAEGLQYGNPDAKPWLEVIASDHIACNGNRFVPLISLAGGFTCALNILFLRRDNPGGLIDNRGDIDNRIKVLFDGLKMPKQLAELGDYAQIDADEDPFYCLLEEDSLVTSVTVTTDRLIVPLKPNQDDSHVMLIVHVTMVNPSAIFAGNRLV